MINILHRNNAAHMTQDTVRWVDQKESVMHLSTCFHGLNEANVCLIFTAWIFE